MSLAIADIVARCQSCGHLLGRPIPDPEPRYLVAGPLTLDLERWTATIGGRVVEFEHPRAISATREWTLLLALARQAGRLVSYASIVRAFYGVAACDVSARHALRMSAFRLRRRLGPDGALLVTHHGRGLRLDVGGTP